MASHGHSVDPGRADDRVPTRAARLRLRRLEHLCRRHSMTHQRQVALIEEARAARGCSEPRAHRRMQKPSEDETRDME
jgi:hypothetical protein